MRHGQVGDVCGSGPRLGAKAGSLSSLRRLSARSTLGRGRIAAFQAGRQLNVRSWAVVVKARVVRYRSGAVGGKPDLSSLRRDGVAKDRAPARMFDSTCEVGNATIFADRCADDRHHLTRDAHPSSVIWQFALRQLPYSQRANYGRDGATSRLMQCSKHKG